MKLLDISTPKRPNTYAKVDDEDFDFLNQWKWWPDNGYARRSKGSIQGPTIDMHCLIMKTPKGMETDHIDGNGLNNQKSNLRLVTTRQNQHNRKKSAGKTSQYIGVHYSKQRGGYVARIKHHEKNYHGGTYKTEVEAAHARDRLTKLHFGETGRLNFPPEKQTETRSEVIRYTIPAVEDPENGLFDLFCRQAQAYGFVVGPKGLRSSKIMNSTTREAQGPAWLEQAWNEIQGTMMDDMLNLSQKRAFVISILKGQLANPPKLGGYNG